MLKPAFRVIFAVKTGFEKENRVCIAAEKASLLQGTKRRPRREMRFFSEAVKLPGVVGEHLPPVFKRPFKGHFSAFDL